MPEVQLLQAEIDETDESYFRFLVDGKTFKYVTIAGGLYASDDLCFGPTLPSLLPEFPDGDWNDGYIDRVADNESPRFVRTIKTEYPGITCTWHPILVDHLELSFGEKLKSNVIEVTSPRFPNPIVAKFARWHWEISYYDHECEAYKWIEGKDIGPKFLGLLTEHGRMNGFIIEKIEGARHAAPNDLEVCREALSRLHKLGILHGDINKHNFLIKNNRATLIDFECAQKCDDEAAFREEMERLPSEIEDMSGRGGVYRMSSESA